MKDFYSILGVPEGASADLIKATYLALSKIYHPDQYKGDKKYATKRMQEINEAYETLKDKKKRNEYDQKFKTNENPSYDDDINQEEHASYQDIIKNEWDFAKDYYPEIEEEFNDLKKVNNKLAWEFQIICIETKSFENAFKLASDLKENWLKRHFGEQRSIQALALKAIEQNNTDVVREINKAVKILGNVSVEKIEDVINKKYPDFFKEEDEYDSNSIHTYKGYTYVSLKWDFFRIIKSPKDDPMSKGMVFTDNQELLDYINKLK